MAYYRDSVIFLSFNCEVIAENRISGTKMAAFILQQRGKYVSRVSNEHSAIEKLLETMFYTRSMLRLYSENQRENMFVV
jgi:hypothetical protein